MSSAFSSLACGCGSKSGARNNGRTESHDFHWEKEDQWHVVAKIYDESPRQKIYNSSVSGDSGDDDGLILPSLLPLPPPASERKKRRGKKKKYSKFRHRMSTSSAESGLFSSESFDEREEEEEEEETETLVSSSRSISTDSSTDFNPQLETIRETTPIPRRQRKNHNKKKRATKNGRVLKVGMAICRSSSVTSPECASPARLSVFKKLIPGNVEGKVKESFAVVKKSEDPFEDFKRSMMEMILEKQMFEERDLEQLLQCFLSLNSRYHHGVIVEAFTEIWDTIFGTARNSTHCCVSS